MKVLVIEDNFLVAETIRDTLARAGCEVIGPAGTVETGLALVANSALDGALLDVNLAGRLCFPIARALSRHEVPFAFLTGYDDPSIIPAEFRTKRRLAKPFDCDELTALVAESFGNGRCRTPGTVDPR